MLLAKTPLPINIPDRIEYIFKGKYRSSNGTDLNFSSRYIIPCIIKTEI